ncbi:MAG: class I SAM-dependent methyltransferase [Pseudomonadota bacterium]
MLKRRLSHLTPAYVVNRAASMWWEHQNPDAPWLPRQAVALLDTLLQPTDHVIEFGAGRSTLWFAQRVATVSAFETDANWCRRVADDISSAGFEDRVQVQAYATRDDLRAFVEAAGATRQFTVALVDGLDAHRDLCADLSMRLLAPGGVLVIDNVQRYLPSEHWRAPKARRTGYASDQWEDVADGLAGWRQVHATDGVNDTAFWVKPAE